MAKRLLIILLLLGFWPFAEAQFYYGLIQEYGKNRVQYNKFEWSYFRYDMYDVYFYKNGRPIAEMTSELVKRNISPVENKLNMQIDTRFQVLVFNSLTDMKQSNIIPSTDEAFNTAGTTRLVGTRMFIYFDGSYANLESQIKEGLALLMINDLLYGGFTSSVTNTALLSLPDWFISGLVSYLTHPWTPEMEAHVKDGIYTNRYKRMNLLRDQEAKYAGHSIWRYIADTYGEGVIRNILYMTVINRSVDNGLEFVVGSNLDATLSSWKQYYRSSYSIPQGKKNLTPNEIVRTRKTEVIVQMALSPQERFFAYTANDLGRYKVYVYDLEKKRKKRILKKGFRIAQNADPTFPVLAWNPVNPLLAMVTEEKGFLWLYFYDAEKKKLEKRNLFGFEKVLSMRYSHDGKELLMSAVNQGRSNIYVYTILSKSITPITNDNWDDLNPEYMNGGRQIVWSSNRTNDTLRWNDKTNRFRHHYNLFAVYRDGNLKNEETKWLWNLTENVSGNATMPREISHGRIGYLAKTATGQQLNIIEIDSTIAYVDTTTHYSYDFKNFVPEQPVLDYLKYDAHKDGQIDLHVVYHKNRYRISKGDLEAKLLASGVRAESLPEGDEPEQDPSVSKEKENFRKKFEIDITDYELDPSVSGTPAPRSSQRDDRRQAARTRKVEEGEPQKPIEEKAEEIPFETPPSRNYFLSFYRDEFDADIGFVFNNPMYQPFTGRPEPGLFNTGFNSNFKLGTFELMNDYRITGAFRTDFRPAPGLSLSPNSEIFIGLFDHRRRLNRDLILYRRSQLAPFFNSTFNSEFITRIYTYEGRYEFTYPFNEVQSIRFSPGFRHERIIYLSDWMQPNSTAQEDQTKDFFVARAAFVHDNVRLITPNIYHGLRYKIFTEYYKDFGPGNTGLHTAGIDLRHYLPVHREMIWANRLAVGTSFGPQKLIHYLGGVDNQINPTNFENNTPIANQDYIFQTVITNMRGFIQNTRNGNSFAVINSEVRVPIVRYMLNRPVRSDFFNNFQIIGFADVGTAWNGFSPYGEENALNNEVVNIGPNLTIIVDKQREPIVWGTGFGIRSRLFGYWVRADWAWGIEDNIILPRVFYLSLSQDF